VLLREQSVEKTPAPKDRLITELDQRIDGNAQIIRDLKRRLDDHEWDHREQDPVSITTYRAVPNAQQPLADVPRWPLPGS
jgi:hypothetical protein